MTWAGWLARWLLCGRHNFCTVYRHHVWLLRGLSPIAGAFVMSQRDVRQSKPTVHVFVHVLIFNHVPRHFSSCRAENMDVCGGTLGRPLNRQSNAHMSVCWMMEEGHWIVPGWVFHAVHTTHCCTFQSSGLFNESIVLLGDFHPDLHQAL